MKRTLVTAALILCGYSLLTAQLQPTIWTADLSTLNFTQFNVNGQSLTLPQDGSQPSSYSADREAGNPTVSSTCSVTTVSTAGIIAPPTGYGDGTHIADCTHHDYCPAGIGLCTGIGNCGGGSNGYCGHSTGTRLFRYGFTSQAAYYGGIYQTVAFLLPQTYVFDHQTSNGRFSLLWQLKSSVGTGGGQTCPGSGCANDPKWEIDIGNRTTGINSPMFLYMETQGTGATHVAHQPNGITVSGCPAACQVSVIMATGVTPLGIVGGQVGITGATGCNSPVNGPNFTISSISYTAGGTVVLNAPTQFNGTPFVNESGCGGSNATEGFDYNAPWENSTTNTQFTQYPSTITPSLNITPGVWHTLTVYIQQWPVEVHPYKGRITVWQDNQLMWDWGGPNDHGCPSWPSVQCAIWTKYGNNSDATHGNSYTGNNQPAWNNYTDATSGVPMHLYFSGFRETPTLPTYGSLVN